MDIKKQIPF